MEIDKYKYELSEIKEVLNHLDIFERDKIGRFIGKLLTQINELRIALDDIRKDLEIEIKHQMGCRGCIEKMLIADGALEKIKER